MIIMSETFKKLTYLVLLLGLLTIHQVHAIDGDYSNPYASSPGEAQGNMPTVWDGITSYGGKTKELPLMTVVGGVFLFFGIGTCGYCFVRQRRQ
ncbi:MAG: hypothetical protein ACI9XC_001394 [Gammaproteobacteria bacterium]|jgi:hypothetical protein